MRQTLLLVRLSRDRALRLAGFGVAMGTVLAMAVQVVAAWARDDPRADDLWAYLVLAGGPALVAIVLGLRGAPHAGWVFLIPAITTAVPGERGLTSHWVYAGLFLLAAVLAQITPKWLALEQSRHTPADRTEVVPLRSVDDNEL